MGQPTLPLHQTLNGSLGRHETPNLYNDTLGRGDYQYQQEDDHYSLVSDHPPHYAEIDHFQQDPFARDQSVQPSAHNVTSKAV